jgi:integrase
MSVFQYKGSKVWTMEFQFQGHRIRETTGTRKKTLALEIERKRRRELEEARAGIRKPQQASFFSEAAKAYINFKSLGWRPSTLSAENYNLEHLLPVFGNKLITEIEATDITAYQKARIAAGASERTVNMEVGTLRATLKRTGHWARLLPNIQLFKLGNGKGQVMTDEMKVVVLEVCRESRSRSLYPFVVLTAETGSRRGTVEKVRWRDIDFFNRCVQWGADKTKSGTGRIVPLNEVAMRCLTEWASNFPNRKPEHYVFPKERYGGSGHKFGEGTIGAVYETDPTQPMGSNVKAWNGARKRAAILLNPGVADPPPLTLRVHDLRHTAFTRMRNNGVPIEKAARVLGWSPSMMVRMAAIYGHFTLDDLRESVDAIQ